MGFGTFFADILPDLEFAQAIDHQWPNDQPGKHCGQASKRSTEG
jgi:hypothetical protein